MSDFCNNILVNDVFFDDVREHKYDCYPRVVADSVCVLNQELCPKMEPKQEFMMEHPNLTAPPKVRGGVGSRFPPKIKKKRDGARSVLFPLS